MGDVSGFPPMLLKSTTPFSSDSSIAREVPLRLRPVHPSDRGEPLKRVGCEEMRDA